MAQSTEPQNAGSIFSSQKSTNKNHELPEQLIQSLHEQHTHISKPETNKIYQK